ncbi:MAG: RHS repeat-associated core domain-containing protein, partial [Methylocella sp.]
MVTAKLATGPCAGNTYTFGSIYYTLNSHAVNSNATAGALDTFTATWMSPDYTVTATFSVNDAKNNGDCGCSAAGDPINTGTGNLFETETDFVGAPHTGLELRRYYNSQDPPGAGGPGAFGPNWTSTFQRSINAASGSLTVQAVHADGRADTFTKNGSGIYAGDPDVTDRLSPVPVTGTQTGWQLVRADDSVETYTLAGLLTSITTRAGLVTRLSNDASNHLIKVTGPFGHTLTFVNDGFGRVTQMTAPDGGVYSYAYNSASGNLASVTYPSSAQRQYVYDNPNLSHALTGIIDEDGNRFATWAYDSQGRAVSSQHAGGADLTTLTYNANGSTSVADARGNVHTFGLSAQFGLVKPTALTGVAWPNAGGKAFTYDTNGFIAKSTDWDGNVTTFTHDTRGDETSRTMAYGTPLAHTITTAWLLTFHLPTQITDGNRIVSFAYDAKGNLLTRTLTSPGMTSTWSYTYNSVGQVLTATDPRGNVTTYTYDAKGDLTSVTDALGHVTSLPSYDADGRPLTIQDPNSLVTTLAYNFRGEITSKTEAKWATAYAYDKVGQLIKLTRPDGSTLAFTYDAAHRLTGISDSLGDQIVYTLDAASNRIKEQVFDPSSNLIRTRSYTYNVVNRLKRTIGAQGQTTVNTYDAQGNLTKIADPLGNTSTYAYDALNRLAQAIDPNSGMTAYEYDNKNRLKGVTDPRGLVTSYTHNGLDDVTSIVSPDTGVTANTFDEAGNAVTSTDARGDKSVYSYDALNRVTKAAFADGKVITYQYDQGAHGIGRLTAMSDPGGTTTWGYNLHGQVNRKQQTSGAVTLTTRRTYNALTGQLASIVYPSGSTISFTYDADGRVSSVSDQPPGGATSSLLSKIVYQSFGPAASWQEGNGASYVRTFDQDGRITGLALPGADTIALTYDAASRITGMTETGLPAKTFTYNTLDRVHIYASGTATQTYTYDADGNRASYATNGTSPIALTYKYDTASNRLLGIGGSSKETFTYDANGNMLSHSSPSADYTYEYDARNRRTETFLGAIATTDVINGLGQRTAKTRESETKFFVYDEAGHLTGQYNSSGGVVEESVWLGDLPVAVLQPSGQFYIAPDHLGSPHQIADAGGAAVWLWDHDPFGNGAPLGAFSYNLRFPGQFYDQRAKLHYNYFRDYDPNTGRYIESDPIGLAGGLNTYAYAGGNPVSGIDPNGEGCPWCA